MPSPVGKKDSHPGMTKLECVVCHIPYWRAPNNVPKAKVCTPKKFNHTTKFKKQPDGSTRKISCACCRCLYKKTLAKHRDLDAKMIPSKRFGEFLRCARETYGETVYLAFRVALNAMLRVTELASLRVEHFKPADKGLAVLEILALKKTVAMLIPVDIDGETAAALKKHIKGRTEGTIFDIPPRTFQHKFKQVARKLDLGHLSMHALRHTGIWNRARSITNLNDLNYLRQQARHESIETTKLYLGYEMQQRMAMAKKVRWF